MLTQGNSRVAGILGRYDLMGGVSSQSTQPTVTAPNPVVDPSLVPNAINVGAPDATVGRIGTGYLAAIVLGCAAFYVWTREHQL